MTITPDQIVAMAVRPDDFELFTGRCDNCGTSLTYLRDHAVGGTIDHRFTDDGNKITWVRHAPAPQIYCRMFSSPVFSRDYQP